MYDTFVSEDSVHKMKEEVLTFYGEQGLQSDLDDVIEPLQTRFNTSISNMCTFCKLDFDDSFITKYGTTFFCIR
jgi:hypothetical protein